MIETPDGTIYYEVLGKQTGVPLVLLNGGPGRSHKNLRISPVWDQLAQGRPLVFYDQRGTGQSSPLEPGVSCTLADQLVDLEALRSHLGVEQIDLLGHSWGGYLAMAYTARYGQRVHRLILVGSAAPRIQDTVMLLEQIFPDLAERRTQLRSAMCLGDQEAFQEFERLFRAMTIHSPEKRAAYLAMAGPSVMHFDVADALNTDLQRYDLRPDLPKFKQPTLVTTGRYDLIVAPSVAYQIHKAIPHSQFVVFEQSGHRPFFEEPKAFRQTVGQFLKQGRLDNVS